MSSSWPRSPLRGTGSGRRPRPPTTRNSGHLVATHPRREHPTGGCRKRWGRRWPALIGLESAPAAAPRSPGRQKVEGAMWVQVLTLAAITAVLVAELSWIVRA